MKLLVYFITAILFTKAFAADQETELLKPALDAITPDGLLAHNKMLYSDEFEGRAPGSKGEELSIKYISDLFKQIGLSPGNPDGTYFQKVPLAGIKTTPSASFAVGGKTTTLNYPDDYVASSARLQNEIRSDEFEGRAPGSKGEELSIKYISDLFKQIGLSPGNPDGTYFQKVPLAGIKTTPSASFAVGGKTTTLNYPDDYVASSARLQNEIKVE